MGLLGNTVLPFASRAIELRDRVRGSWAPPAAVEKAELPAGDGREQALEHLRAALRALGYGGRTHAGVFRELRLLVNKLENGGLPESDWPEVLREEARGPRLIPEAAGSSQRRGAVHQLAHFSQRAVRRAFARAA